VVCAPFIEFAPSAAKRERNKCLLELLQYNQWCI